jgi:hypothetical protein
VIILAGLDIIVNFVLYGLTHESLYQFMSLFNVLFYFIVYFIEKAWEGAEKGRSQHLDILYQILYITRTVSYSKTKHETSDVDDLLLNVGQGHVGQVNIVRIEVEAQMVGRYLS